jgi:cytosine/uracil/thiamine/allantoin permease
MTSAHTPVGSPDSGLAHHHLDDIGWGLFLIMTGVIWLYPESQLPKGTWLIGTGLLFLGLNAVRALAKAPVSGFTTLLGTLALLAGLAASSDIHVPFAAICLILLGGGLLLRPIRRHPPA